MLPDLSCPLGVPRAKRRRVGFFTFEVAWSPDRLWAAPRTLFVGRNSANVVTQARQVPGKMICSLEQGVGGTGRNWFRLLSGKGPHLQVAQSGSRRLDPPRVAPRVGGPWAPPAAMTPRTMRVHVCIVGGSGARSIARAHAAQNTNDAHERIWPSGVLRPCA